MAETYRTHKEIYEEARLNKRSNPELINVRLVEYSSVPPKPTRPHLFFIAISVLASLPLAVAFIPEYLDHCVNDPETAERALGISGLGSVEQFGLLRAIRSMIRALGEHGQAS